MFTYLLQFLYFWFSTFISSDLLSVFSDKDEGFPLRNLSISELNFVHTTDTHGWYSGHLNQKTYAADWGDFISFTQHLKNLINSQGNDLILIDSGDRHDGNGLSDITIPNGNRSIPIFSHQDYDLVTLGNHELYEANNSYLEYDYVAPHYGDNYVNSNVEILVDGHWKTIGNRYRYFETPIRKLRILALSFLFDFRRNNEFTRVTPIKEAIHQNWFQEILNNHPQDKVDSVVIVGHVPIDRGWHELEILHAELRTHYPDVKIQYFGGHSHIRDFLVYDDKLVALQSGRFCETVGFLSVNVSSTSSNIKDIFARSYIDFNRRLFLHHTKLSDFSSFVTKEGFAVKKLIHDARKELGLNKAIGKVVELNYFVDYVPLTHPKNLFRLLTSRVLPSLKPDKGVKTSDERITIINTGSVRYDLYKGPYTVDTHFIISPFQNDWSKITVPKYIAVQIAPKLNENGYIVNGQYSNSNLLPPHQLSLKASDQIESESNLGIVKILEDDKKSTMSNKLSKGYVTRDDFGTDGDDTPHRAVINYPIPNVVQTHELKKLSRQAPVDVVFYNFITPNVLEALQQLGYPAPEVEHYSKRYLGLLLDEFVSKNEL